MSAPAHARGLPGGVIFDCDGVLVDSERLVSEVEHAALRRVGIELSPQALHEQLKGHSLEHVLTHFERLAPAALPRSFFYELAMGVAARFVAQLRPVEGVGAVVEAVRARGLPCCVASQSPPPRVELSLRVTGLLSAFEGRIFSATMVSRPKPAPDLFLLAAREIGVPAAQCVVIEDSPIGAEAGRAAGMRVLGYAAQEDPAALEAHGAETFTSMQQVPGLLGLARA